MLRRCYSILHVKAVREDERVIRGTATTPTPDRVGDIVEPLGIKFKNPLPLLWHHDSSEPVGTAKFDKPTKEGVEFEARLPNVDEPGTLKDRIDEAWQSIKLGLVRGVSIGFRAIEYAFIDDGGIRFIESEVLELSLVTIPANSDATIQQIKSIDSELLAVSGKRQVGNPSGVPAKPIALAPKDARKVKTIAEQIEAFEAKRAANDARMKAIQATCTDESRGKNEAEREEFDRLRDEQKVIDAELVDLREMEAANKAAVVVVDKVESPQAAAANRNGNGKAPVVSVKSQVPKGIAFARYARAKAMSVRQMRSPYDIAKDIREWDNTPEVALALSADVEMLMKAAIGVGTTTDSVWAAPLVAYQVMASEFIEYLRPLTIIGRIPGLRRVPFNIQMPRETSPTSVAWVGEDAPKPVSKAAFDTVQMRWAKAAGIVLLTEELVRFSNPNAEALIRDDLAASMAQFLDRQFVDPSVAAVTNVSPASITNGVSPSTATGTTAAAFRLDAGNMLKSVLSNNLRLSSGVWIMTQQQAVAFSLMVTSLGVPLYPGMAADGGTLLGYPVIASENIPATGGSPADGYPIIFALAGEIMLADDGQTVIDASREASVQMDSTPDSPPTASTTMVSLWQMNYVGLRAERWINWLKRRSTAVSFIQNAKYQE